VASKLLAEGSKLQRRVIILLQVLENKKQNTIFKKDIGFN
jgi:hypothetical protein